ncbi:hypothetical protein MTO96_021785, partial [Rhipicephalus appendiculatus]
MLFKSQSGLERMVDACLTNRPDDDTKALEQLLGFMRSSVFGFTDANVSESDYSEPLKGLTKLAYNWTLPLWFSVDFLSAGVANRALTISTSALGDFYATFHKAIIEYEDVYN